MLKTSIALLCNATLGKNVSTELITSQSANGTGLKISFVNGDGY